ncbi:hypothetical protein CGRA01v4_11354 [Colletotrichum graminicola]|nr:hypothetical protein CGRA01v4_11354 [Colletotrichum graminicola]
MRNIQLKIQYLEAWTSCVDELLMGPHSVFALLKPSRLVRDSFFTTWRRSLG